LGRKFRALPPAGMCAAIDVQYLSCDLTGFRQIDDCVHDVPYAGNLPHRLQRLEEIPQTISVHRCVDDARRNRIHTDALFGVFHRETPRDGLEAALGDHWN
jgi:hypothetical protein